GGQTDRDGNGDFDGRYLHGISVYPAAIIGCVSRTAIFLLAAAFSWSCALAGDPDLPNFQEVNEHVFRGGQPSDDGFKNMAQRGIKTVVDLRTAGEHSLSHEKQVVEADGMRFVSIPMKGLGAPSLQQISAALGILEDKENWPVFVHCR